MSKKNIKWILKDCWACGKQHYCMQFIDADGKEYIQMHGEFTKEELALYHKQIKEDGK